jgi:hypothetical protein
MDSEKGKTPKESHPLKEISSSENEQAQFDRVQLYFSVQENPETDFNFQNEGRIG